MFLIFIKYEYVTVHALMYDINKFNKFYSPVGSHKLYSYLRCNINDY